MAGPEMGLSENSAGGTVSYTGSHSFEVTVGGVRFSVPVNPPSKVDPTPKVPTVYPKELGSDKNI